MDRKNKAQSHDTFIVRVDHHQNDSWQGRIVWADENKTERFRSSLELMRFIDEAIKGAEA